MKDHLKRKYEALTPHDQTLVNELIETLAHKDDLAHRLIEKVKEVIHHAAKPELETADAS